MFKKIITLTIVLSCTNIYSQAFGVNNAFTEEDNLLANTNFVENYETRRLFRRAIEEFRFEEMEKEDKLFNQTTSNHLIKVSVVQKENSFLLIFSNETLGSSIERFSLHTKGNVAIEKKIESGAVNYMRIFLQDDGLSYIEVKPNGTNESLISVLIDKVYLYHNVPIRQNFSIIAISPVSKIMKLTNSMIDWKLVIPNNKQQFAILMQNFTKSINPYLQNLLHRDTEDGAMNNNGEFVYIDTEEKQLKSQGGFNCSGFVKWLADAFYSPLNNGALMDIKDLKILSPKRKTSSINQNFPNRDPYFGLDWVRNIALKMAKTTNPNRRIDFDTTDVSDTPFFSYIPDIGYPISDLKAILYVQTLINPNKFYLGSINKDFGSNPMLRQHFHTVALFPYFNNIGNFVVEVYERNQNTSLESLTKTQAGSYIHLSNIQILEDFSLPPIN